MAEILSIQRKTLYKQSLWYIFYHLFFLFVLSIIQEQSAVFLFAIILKFY